MGVGIIGMLTFLNKNATIFENHSLKTKTMNIHSNIVLMQGVVGNPNMFVLSSQIASAPCALNQTVVASNIPSGRLADTFKKIEDGLSALFQKAKTYPIQRASISHVLQFEVANEDRKHVDGVLIQRVPELLKD